MYTYCLNNGRLRKTFDSSIKLLLYPPYLLLTQTKTYKDFLQISILPKLRSLTGIENIFRSIFPIISVSGYKELHFLGYRLSKPNFKAKFCKIKSQTLSVALKVILRFVFYDKSFFYETKKLIKSSIQEVYLGDIPLMTNNGSFIINGIERVVVSQLHRSPGLFCFYDCLKIDHYEKKIYFVRIIPFRGLWFDFEFDNQDLLYFRIDRKKKIYLSILFQALGFSKVDIISFFCCSFFVVVMFHFFFMVLDFSLIQDKVLDFAIFDIFGGILIPVGSLVTAEKIKLLKSKKISKVLIPHTWLLNRTLFKSFTLDKNLELVNLSILVNNFLLYQIFLQKIKILSVLGFTYGYIIFKTLINDFCTDTACAISEICKLLKSNDPAIKDVFTDTFKFLFCSLSEYNFSFIGRMKLNNKFRHKYYCGLSILSYKDLVDSTHVLLDAYYNNNSIDDIDHLGNRRIKAVGEIMEDLFYVGLRKVDKIVRERLSIISTFNIPKPQSLVSPKPITIIMKDFFCTGALSQFMDQDNTLSEITHKRKVSSLGPGGLLRDHASFEVRDIHYTHYSKLCPIETPEGHNIGLINSLACFSLLNLYGFLEAPYRQLFQGYITNNIFYFSALEEEFYLISSIMGLCSFRSYISKNILVQCRQGNSIISVEYFKVEFVDISSVQLVSVAASLIPFLEHNDANRALMSSNMQRQTVPLLYLESPLIGTGMEIFVGYDSKSCIIAKRKGIVCFVDSQKIIIKCNILNSKKALLFSNNNNIFFDIYNFTKFQRSNKNTCINYVSNVKVGDLVLQDDILVDGFGVFKGELSLGKNLLVAFMPFHGLNFEDSIILSENIVNDNKYTSLHLEELVCYVRNTKLGPEEIMFDTLDVNNNILKKLDIFGIVNTGATVLSGDVLVAKFTPKIDKQIIPEEKLLKAIFGEKSSNMKDTSLRVPNGLSGVVVDVNIISRGLSNSSVCLEHNQNELENRELYFFKSSFHYKNSNFKNSIYCRIYDLFYFGLLYSDLHSQLQSLFEFENIDFSTIILRNCVKLNFSNYLNYYRYKIKQTYQKYKRLFNNNIMRTFNENSEFALDIIKIIKVSIIVTKQIQSGDKMSGRHGNKGVVSKVVSTEDMPYLLNGTPIDIVLNPLGVPSRMNVGQLFETYMGFIMKNIGFLLNGLLMNKQSFQNIVFILLKIYGVNYFNQYFSRLFYSSYTVLKDSLEGICISSPVFQGVTESDFSFLLNIFNFSFGSQHVIYNGISGNKIERLVTVGYMYILKLDHLVDDKIHARSIGSYSLIIQQPLGGRAQFGGQRLGEMEVWALQAYGAAYILREMLTIKSDDIVGRVEMYKNIIDGIFDININIPESFNVLLREIKALGINIKLELK